MDITAHTSIILLPWLSFIAFQQAAVTCHRRGMSVDMIQMKFRSCVAPKNHSAWPLGLQRLSVTMGDELLYKARGGTRGLEGSFCRTLLD